MIRERVLTKEAVEYEALRVLQTYAQDHKGSMRPPIDVDMIGEAMFELVWDWDTIDDSCGKGATAVAQGKPLIILAGLYPRQRRVVMNEMHAEVFKNKPGLERFTKGHEIGHWVLHIDHAVLNHPTLFDQFDEDPDPSQTIICRDGDDTWIERQANWFSAGLLMPTETFLDAARRADFTKWRARYEMAEHFGVTISALGTRLNRFGFSFVDENGRIHRSAAEAQGQIAFR